MKRRALFFFLILFFASVAPAYAYLEPGSGSLIIQIIIGVFSAIFFTVKTYWLKIKAFFTHKPDKPR